MESNKNSMLMNVDYYQDTGLLNGFIRESIFIKQRKIVLKKHSMTIRDHEMYMPT